MDYYDNVIGANVVDVMDVANQLGFSRISLLTHGSNTRNDEVPQMIREIGERQRVEISFHLNNPDVYNFVKKSLDDGNVDLKRRENLIDRYVEKYAPMIEAAMKSKKGFLIRNFKFNDEIKSLLNPDAFMQKMKEIVERAE